VAVHVNIDAVASVVCDDGTMERRQLPGGSLLESIDLAEISVGEKNEKLVWGFEVDAVEFGHDGTLAMTMTRPQAVVLFSPDRTRIEVHATDERLFGARSIDVQTFDSALVAQSVSWRYVWSGWRHESKVALPAYRVGTSPRADEMDLESAIEPANLVFFLYLGDEGDNLLYRNVATNDDEKPFARGHYAGVEVSPSGRLVAAVHAGGVKVWATEEAEEAVLMHELALPPRRGDWHDTDRQSCSVVRKLRWSSDEELLAAELCTAFDEHRVITWRL